MNIIIPMAGIGKRMRPFTFTTPKPLFPVAGKPIIELLIRDIAKMLGEKIDQVSFIIGNFGSKVENELISLANQLGYDGKIYYQTEALGTAHALYCAKESLNGNIFIAFADTLFNTDFKVDTIEDSIIWTKKIDDPKLFGVVVPDNLGYIKHFAEKPKNFVSDLAIIGIYYFREGEILKNEIKYLLDNHITGNGEYQITDALDIMKNKGIKIKIAKVDGWFDCGNKEATVQTNQEIFKLKKDLDFISSSAIIEDSTILHPCNIDDHVKILSSTIGPFVSIGNGTVIEHSQISNSIILNNSEIHNAEFSESIIGSYVKYVRNSKNLSIGDYSELI